MQCYSPWPLHHITGRRHDIISISPVKTSNQLRFSDRLSYRHRRRAAFARAVLSVGKSESAVPTGEAYTYSVSAQPLIDATTLFKSTVRPSPVSGLISLLFVQSMVLGAILSLAVVSIPAMINLGRLAASMDKLSEVASKEVPGTLLSLKLSGVEIKDLTEKLSNLSVLDWEPSLFPSGAICRLVEQGDT